MGQSKTNVNIISIIVCCSFFFIKILGYITSVQVDTGKLPVWRGLSL